MYRSIFALAALAAATMACAIPTAIAQGKAAAREAYCANKPNASEREICRDKGLTRHDGVLNEVYQDLRKKLGKSDFKSLRTEQRAWLSERNRCGKSTGCLATKYTDRIAVLEQMLENLAYPNKSHVEIGCGADQVFVNGECRDNDNRAGASTSPDSDMVWHANGYNDPGNKGRYTVTLRYGIPETDAVAFDAICVAGSSGTFATTVIGYNTGALREGTAVVLNVSSPGYIQKLDGNVYGTKIEEGVSGVLLHPEFDDPLWLALAGGGSLKYRVNDQQTSSLNLDGSAAVVRKFIADCKSIVPVTNDNNLSAKNRTCDQFGTVKSKNSKTPVTVKFINKTDAYRSIMWINFEGTPVEHANLDPGQSHTVKTYLTHPWMFTDGPGNCIEMFMPEQGVSTFEITAESPAFGPEDD